MRIRHLALGLLGLIVTACVSQQTMHLPLTEVAYPPKPPTFEIEFYTDSLPQRPFQEIAKLNVHIEKTSFRTANFETAKEQLASKARSLGADALIKIVEDRSQLNETHIYNVSAIAIVWSQNQ